MKVVNSGTTISDGWAIGIQSDASYGADLTRRNVATIIGRTAAFNGTDVDSIPHPTNSGENYGDIKTIRTAFITNRGLIEGDITSFDGADRKGALAVHVFSSGLDTLAQDADDRFLFPTTDHTPWSDRDGVGGVYAPVLLATMANGVNLTAADLLVF